MKKTLSTVFMTVLAAVMMFSATACNGGNTDVGDETGGETVTVSISQTTAELIIGQTVTLTATASDESKITWTTSDDDIATVSSRGIVAGIAEGEATITASSGEASATCIVTVEAPEIVTVTISQETAEVDRGATVQLSAEASDESQIKWSSSSEVIATVDETGKVTGVSEGTAVITAKSGDASASCTVTVTDLNKPEGSYDIIADKVNSAADKTWFYIKNTKTVVERAEYRTPDVEVSFNSNPQYNGLQMLYKDTEKVGDYILTMKIATDTAGSITVNNTVVVLNKGENDIKVYYNSEDVSTAAAIFMGTSTAEGTTYIAGANLTISDFEWQTFTRTPLAVPSISIADKVATITDTNPGPVSSTNIDGGAASYELAFFKEGTDEVAYTRTTTEKTYTIDDRSMVDGTYDVKVRAIADGKYADSDWSTIAKHTVDNSNLKYDVTFTDEKVAVAMPGVWQYWSTGSGDSNTMKSCVYDKGNVTFEIVNNTSPWYATQLFYDSPNVDMAKEYTLKLTITASDMVLNDGATTRRITVNGQHFDLKEGENVIEVTRKANVNKASISIQMGIEENIDGVKTQYLDIVSGKFVISNVSFVQDGVEIFG